MIRPGSPFDVVVVDLVVGVSVWLGRRAWVMAMTVGSLLVVVVGQVVCKMYVSEGA